MMQRKGERGMSLHTHLSDAKSTSFSSHKRDMTISEKFNCLKSFNCPLDAKAFYFLLHSDL